MDLPAGDFEQFVRESATGLLHMAVLLTGDVTAGEDLLQATLEKVYARWSVGHPPDNPDAYTRKAMVHAARRLWRRRSADREFLVSEPPETAMGYDDAAGGALLRVALLHVIGTLPLRQRAVIALRYLEDRSEAETASILGCSVGTVKTHAHRALRRLRQEPMLAGYLLPVADPVLEA
ncbi:MAG TPA: SigE family RNA polymerase sigma factor [Frankiaceae bacterium]|nr:SigE family RNA polymerase sigma factor [Frankiaceae bacterium]